MMQALSAAAVARVLMMNDNGVITVEGEDIALGSLRWYIYADISFFFFLFASIISGLTLGLMSLGLVELEILQRSETPTEKK